LILIILVSGLVLILLIRSEFLTGCTGWDGMNGMKTVFYENNGEL